MKLPVSPQSDGVGWLVVDGRVRDSGIVVAPFDVLGSSVHVLLVLKVCIGDTMAEVLLEFSGTVEDRLDTRNVS